MYAFFSRDMFEMVPAARRVAERAAIEDLGLGVVIVDAGGRIIDSNSEAGRVLGVDAATVLGDPVDTHLPDVDPGEADQTVSLVVDGQRREYRVATSPLEDSTGTRVGDSLVLQDVTAEVQREQRLAVLNRVLRHNLRNDLNVVHGFLGIARAQVDDDGVRSKLATAESKTADVMALGEKARDIEQVVGAAGTAGPVDLDRVLASVVDDHAESHPGASIDVDGDTGVTLWAEERLLDRVVWNLVENALEHADTSSPSVTVSVAAPNQTATDRGVGDDAGERRRRLASVVVADDGPGIPPHELDALGAARETALEHGSGLGLWVVTWGVDALGGRVAFDADADGTTVTLRLPVADEATASARPFPTGLPPDRTTTER